MAGFLGENSKVYVAGEEGSPLTSITGKPVRIEDIRAQFSRGNLWQDPDFPPNPRSIGAIQGDAARGGTVDSRIPRPENLRWIRPYEVCKIKGFDRPYFAIAQDGLSVKKCSEYDVEQGTALGDCWYVAGVQALTTKPDILNFVIPADNFTGFDDDKYCGAFHFRFYSMGEGKWVDIVVDDLIPWRDDYQQAAMANVVSDITPTHAEYWVALIEKAYAKMHGSYAAISGGYPSQGLENFSNGFGEIMELKKVDTHNLGGQAAAVLKDQYSMVKQFLLSYIKGDAFLAVDSYSEQDPAYASVADGYGDAGKGLHGPHAYTILDVQEVPFNPNLGIPGSRTLVKLKNPWGRGEWTGAFSDRDNINWSQMAKDLRTVDQYGNKNINEGVFWMDLRDVIHFFNQLEICHFGLTDGTRLAMAKGAWPPALQDVNPPYESTDRMRYKAYKFEVQQGPYAAKYSTKSGGKALLCYTLVLQNYTSLYFPGVMFSAELYKMESPDQPLQDVYNATPIRQTDSIGREASSWTFVDPGYYVIVAILTTGQVQVADGLVRLPPEDFAGKTIGYTLRVFTENEAKIEEVQEDPSYENVRPIPPDAWNGLDNQLRGMGLGGLSNLGGGGGGGGAGGLDLQQLANLLKQFGGQVSIRRG